jgi:hypothetical protein
VLVCSAHARVAMRSLGRRRQPLCRMVRIHSVKWKAPICRTEVVNCFLGSVRSAEWAVCQFTERGLPVLRVGQEPTQPVSNHCFRVSASQTGDWDQAHSPEWNRFADALSRTESVFASSPQPNGPPAKPGRSLLTQQDPFSTTTQASWSMDEECWRAIGAKRRLLQGLLQSQAESCLTSSCPCKRGALAHASRAAFLAS